MNERKEKGREGEDETLISTLVLHSLMLLLTATALLLLLLLLLLSCHDAVHEGGREVSRGQGIAELGLLRLALLLEGQIRSLGGSIATATAGSSKAM